MKWLYHPVYPPRLVSDGTELEGWADSPAAFAVHVATEARRVAIDEARAAAVPVPIQHREAETRAEDALPAPRRAPIRQRIKERIQ